MIKNISQVNLSLRYGSVVFGEAEYNPRGVCGPRVQGDFQLVVLHSGTLHVKTGDDPYELIPGQAILLAPGREEFLQFSWHHSSHHSWCALHPKSIKPQLKKTLRSCKSPITLPIHLVNLLKTGKELITHESEHSNLRDEYYLSLATALLQGFADAYHGHLTPSRPETYVFQRFQEFISREYRQDLKLADLAKAAGVSRQHLLKLFRIAGKPTPTKMLYQLRTAQGAELLQHTGMSLSEISDQCGFQNPFHFSRRFKQRFGMSPRDYRKQCWGTS
ncbi:MAG: AraC family transcriptional regulator [Verrucomicrobiota bacterium]